MDGKRDVRKLPGLIAGIKIEPGTLGAPPGRLPSFGGRRDLTLGSSGPSKNQNTENKHKRIYTPNLNVQRNKNRIDLNIKEDHPNSKDKRDRRKDEGKGRRRDKPNNLIQSTGVFAEGIAASTLNKRYGGGGGGDRDSTNFISKPKLNLKHDRKVDKEEEEMKLKELLRDDFIDDPGMDPDSGNAPVRLPMLSKGILKKEIKEEKKPTVKTELVIGVKIKKEVIDEEEEQDVKPTIENGEVKFDKKSEITKIKKQEDLDPITVKELVQSKEAELIFLQMPDCLPGLKPESETGPARSSTSAKPSTSVSSQSNDTTQSSTSSKHCTFSTLSEGHIGKLQILKSGRARLVLGNTVLHVELGTQVGFRQDLISVDLDQSTQGGNMINLGPVKTRLVCSPDWETMLMKDVT